MIHGFSNSGDADESADAQLSAHDTFELAIHFDQSDDFPAAEEAYRTADELGHARAAVNLGVLLEERDDLNGAEQAFRRADERGDATGAFHLAWLLQESGDLTGAVEAYRRAETRGHPAADANLRMLLAYGGIAEAVVAPKADTRPAADDESLANEATTQPECAAVTPRMGEKDSSDGLRKLTAGTARMATAAGLRQVLSMGALAITAAVVARYLGPRNFGVYAGGTAGYTLALVLTDLGFSLVLIREMSQHDEQQPHFMGVALRAQLLWSTVLACGLVGLGLGAGGQRGLVMIVLAPAIAVNGLSVTRGIFSVRFRATPLLVMDLATTFLQCVGMVILALVHAPVIAFAINLSAWTSTSAVLALMLARRVVTLQRPSREEVLAFVRIALPLGIASVLSSLYFTIDQTLLGWLVPARALGQYSAAVRLLTIVVVIPGFILTAGVTGLSRTRRDPQQLSRFAATLAHWIAVSALPVIIGLAIFARPAVLILYGSHYLGAVPLIRILMIAGLLAFVSNITGVVLMTQGIVRPQIIFNTISLIANVGGNLLLAPRFGVVVSAWLTVASEAIVVSYGVVVLRRRLSFPLIVEKVWRPAASIAVAGSVGLILGAGDAVAIAASSLAFLLTLTLIRGWPSNRDEDMVRDHLVGAAP